MNHTPRHDLEPRVARLETGLEILTKNVNDLAVAMRENTVSLENKLENLTVAVTQAQAPKKTDWSTIFAGLAVMLAIGSAVFWPLNQATIDNKEQLKTVHDLVEKHTELPMHPVGLVEVDKLKEHIDHTENGWDMAMKALESKVDLHHDRIYNRVVRLEEFNYDELAKDQDELRRWRLGEIIKK